MASVTALGTDTVTLGGTAAGVFANKNAGTAKAVIVSGNTIRGIDAGNYTLVQQRGLTANITPASLTVSGLTAGNKVYDTLTTAALGGMASVTALPGDAVTVGGIAAGTFANSNVGNGKVITVSGNTLNGVDAGNYVLIQQSGLTANITPANLAVGGPTAKITSSGSAAVTAVLTSVAQVVTSSGLSAGNNEKTKTPTSSVSSGVLQINIPNAPLQQFSAVKIVDIPKGRANFSFSVYNIGAAKYPEVQGSVTLEDGSPLPKWLNFDGKSGKLSARMVPEGAFPFELLVRHGSNIISIILRSK